MKIGLITLGCPKNTVDSELIKGAFESQQVNFVEQLDQADTIIINTCGFIQSAKEEAIETIFGAVKLKENGVCSRVIVTGCLVSRYQQELADEIPEVDWFIDSRDVPKLLSQISQHIDVPYSPSGRRRLLTPPHTAYLKIAEGCNNRCSYCAIPLIKGPLRSRQTDELVTEANELADGGVRELIVIAQDTTQFGVDLNGDQQLAALLKRLAGISSLRWIRLMYTHPAHYSDELIDVMASEAKICKYVDVPLQHISDPILTAMGRRVTRAQTEALIQKLRDRIPGIALRTSFIAGFPGETDEQFNELLDFVNENRFERMGAFAYSKEEGTRSFDLPNQIPYEIRQERVEALMNAQAIISAENNAVMLNQEVEVVIDEFESESGYFLGRTEHDAPEIDNVVMVFERSCKPGQFYYVKITDTYDFDLVGNILPDQSPPVANYGKNT